MSKTEIIKKRNKKDRILLDSWHPYIFHALQAVHGKFRIDSKLILTESDLKCWLFYYLQLARPFKRSYSVHSEVTHYAQHSENNKGKKSKYKFRDLSLLCPRKIKANEKFLSDGVPKKDILSKGFRHKAAAIHFELKFVRENGVNYQDQGLMDDIEKLKSYVPQSSNRIRDFIIVCGSRSENTKVENLENQLNKFNNEMLNNRVWIYLFDKKKLLGFKYINEQCKLLKINSLQEMLENVRKSNN